MPEKTFEFIYPSTGICQRLAVYYEQIKKEIPSNRKTPKQMPDRI